MDKLRAASDSWSAQSLPVPLRCPVCTNMLVVDQCWLSPHWLCPSGHSYSNLRVLIAELRERGWLPDEQPASEAAYSGEVARQVAVPLY